MTKYLLMFFAAALSLGGGELYAQAPSISYNYHPLFKQDIPVTAFTIINSGGAVPVVSYGKVTTLAGSGAAGSTNGTGAAASFNAPQDVAVDGAGNVYVADKNNNQIRKITPAGAVSVLAGTTTAGFVDGASSVARFNAPNSVAVDHAGNVYVADQGNNSVRKVTPNGAVSTLYTAEAVADPKLAISNVGIDGNDNLYASPYSFYYNNTIKITAAGIISTFPMPEVGSALSVTANGSFYFLTPSYYGPLGQDFTNIWQKYTPPAYPSSPAGTAGYDLAADKLNNFYTTTGNGIQKTTAANSVSIIAGSAALAGDAQGIGADGRFNAPQGIATDSLGNLYVADQVNNKIKKVSVYGYQISAPLPAGLFFDGTNGTISGTPTVTSPATNYTITAYNSSGQSSTTISIEVAPLLAITYGITDFDPKPSVKGITYASSNAAVATVVNNKIHVTGAGITFISGQLGGASQSVPIRVNKATLTVTADNQLKEYTAANPPLTLSYSGFVYGDGPGNLTTLPVASTVATAASAVGPYPITLSGGTAANYNLVLVPGNLIVTSLTAFTYGVADFEPRPGVTGITYTSSNPAVATIVNGKVHITGVGITKISSSVGGTSSSQIIQLNKATLTITADNKTRVDNAPNPMLTVSYTGFVYGEGPANLVTLPVLATTAQTNSVVSHYPITISGAAAVNYNIIYTPGTLTIAAQTVKPNISYSGTQSLRVGTPIAPQVPVNTGGIVPQTIFANTSTLVGNLTPGNVVGKGPGVRFQYLGEIQSNGNGDMFLNNLGWSNVTKISLDTVVTYAIDGSAYNMAVDPEGNLFYTAGSRCIERTTTNQYIPFGNYYNGKNDYTAGGMAIDATSRILYLTDQTHFQIEQITPGKVISTYAGTGTYGTNNGPIAQATFSAVQGIYIDYQGNKFVAENNDYYDKVAYHAIRKITPAGIVSTLANVPNTIYQLTGDRAGNIYFSTRDGSQASIPPPQLPIIYKADMNGNVTVLAGTATNGFANGVGTNALFNQPGGLTCDGSGNLYISEYGNNMVRSISLTGYTISPALPAGLLFDGTTGTISGTPTATMAATNYTVIAYNAAGADTATINITVAAPVGGSLQAGNGIKQPVVHAAVSPNGDGVNDALVIDNIGNYPQNKLTLINNTGSKVFETFRYDNFSNAFKGYSNLNGKRLPEGTYFYGLQYNDNGVVKTTTGYFVIKY